MTMLALLASVTYAASAKIGDLIYTYNGRFQESGTASVSLASFDATSVTIPATVVIKGNTYDVTAIDDHGFTNRNWIKNVSYTYDGKTYNINDNSYVNNVLESVTFEYPSNIKTIGEGAFQACTKLSSVVIPNSVTTMKDKAFYACFSLSDVSFQTKEDNTVDLKVLPTSAFSYCPFTSIELPEGIEEIGDRSFQYNFYLKTMKLPNTLKKIGPHFLCDAKSITTLTIPASVTYIDGAAFHGCENLKTVYLLGPASTLIANESNSKTFGANKDIDNAPDCERVTNCTFWVLEEYETGYTSDKVWMKVDQPNNNDGNDIMCIKNTTRTFAQGWGTAIFPKEVVDFRKTAGEGAKVARMIKAVRDNSDMNLYHLTFQVVEGKNIPAKEPLMIYCPYEWTCTMYDSTDENDADFKLEMTKRFTTTVTVENERTSKVHMIGKYLREKLAKWEFYFMNDKFWRVPDDTNAATMGSFRCYWKVDRDGIKQDVASFSKMSFGDNTPTAIEGIETEPTKVQVEVYDLNGRRIYQKKESLPRGLYIINGKKVIIK